MFFQQAYIRHGHAAVDGLAHVVDGQQGDLDSGQRLHLHAGRADGFYGGRTDHVGWQCPGGRMQREFQCHAGKRQRMAQGDQIAGFFGGLDACNAGDAEHVSLFGRAGFDESQGGCLHVDTSRGNGNASGAGLGADVDHMGLAPSIKMGQRIHGKSRLYKRSAYFDHHTSMTQASAFHWKDRFQASGIHLGLSLLIAALAALLVFGLWYPYPYRDSSGGRELFLMVVTVDVILGPLITLAVFNRGKPRAVLARDLAFVGAFQLAALTYGLWVVAAARPVHLVYESDRFTVVHAVEVPAELLDQVSSEVRPMPWMGPTLLAVRPFKNDAEKFEATLMALRGLPLAARADLWQPYPQARQRVLAEAKPVAELKQRFSQQEALINTAVAQTGQQENALLYLPMVERKSFWTVLLDATSAEVRGFIPLDSF